MLDIPAALVIGSICGLLGALFISINTRLTICRKKYINTGPRKLIEAFCLASITALTFYMVTFSRRNDCILKPQTNTNGNFRFFCPENYYNPFASLVFNTESGIIRQLLNQPVEMKNN